MLDYSEALLYRTSRVVVDHVTSIFAYNSDDHSDDRENGRFRILSRDRYIRLIILTIILTIAFPTLCFMITVVLTRITHTSQRPENC